MKTIGVGAEHDTRRAAEDAEQAHCMPSAVTKARESMVDELLRHEDKVLAYANDKATRGEVHDSRSNVIDAIYKLVKAHRA